MTVEISGRRDMVFRCRRILVFMIGTAGEIPFMKRFSKDDQISYYGRIKRIREGLGLSESSLTRALRRLQDDGILSKNADGSYKVIRKRSRKRK